MLRPIAAALSIIFAAGMAAAQPETAPKPAEQRGVVGYLERVRLYPGNFLIYAKIDTGARTSSLHAQDIAYVDRDGQTFVRFSVTNRDGQTQTFERLVIRRARIRDLGRAAQVRPVIMLGLCIGNVYRFTQVNLSNRKGFNFQMLVGRRFLAQRLLVDPVRQYTVEPSCPRPDHSDLSDGRLDTSGGSETKAR